MTVLAPAFSKTGTITAANASKINDGACAISKLNCYLSSNVLTKSKKHWC